MGLSVWGCCSTALAVAGLCAACSQPSRPSPADAGVDSGASAPSRPSAETERVYLSANATDDMDDVPWAFSINSGARAGEWSTLPVPSHWEFFGFGSLQYGNEPTDERGTYRAPFTAPAAWAGKRVALVFEGSLTDTAVSINGKSAGPAHQGGFTRFEYDISELITPGENQLEVVVSERSESAAVNGAERAPDAWSFGGIYRPVYLDVRAPEHIQRFAVHALPNGELSADVYIPALGEDALVSGAVTDGRVNSVGRPISVVIPAGSTHGTLHGHYDAIEAWSADRPTTYLLELELRVGGELRHLVRDWFGFRSVEVRPGDGVYVNGKRVKLRGVSRRGSAPESGRALATGWSEREAGLLKGMNANAVRDAHFPAEEAFLDAADDLGLYVLEELPGTAGNAYDAAVGQRLIEELVTSRANHPSIIFWGNGSDGGWNPELDAEFSRWDPSARPVLHPGGEAAGIHAPADETQPELVAELAAERVVLPTSLLTAWYDGGGGAGLDDYWQLILDSPRAAGAFLWSFADEAIRPGLAGFDRAQNPPPDGLVDADRRPEGSYYTIRDIWCPVQIPLASLPPGFSGAIPVQNRYEFADLAGVTFRWRLAKFHFGPGTGFTIAAQGSARTEPIAPGGSGTLQLALPEGWQHADALELDAGDAYGRLIGKWSWMLQSPAQVRAALVPAGSAPSALPADAGLAGSDAGAAAARVSVATQGGHVRVSAGSRSYVFDPSTGRLLGVSAGGQEFSLRDGPVLAAGESALTSFVAAFEGDEYVLTASYAGELQQAVWRVSMNGWLALRYRYGARGTQDYFGVSFDYPEARVLGVQWLGRGPGRVWKNRMRGAWHDVWELRRPEAAGGWDDPPFAGYFADVYWMRLNTTEGSISIVLDTPGMFVRLFTPASAPDVAHASAPFPRGSLSLLNGIPAIGQKLFEAKALGPQSQPHVLAEGSVFEASVYFRFGDAEP